jgi:hypothetical protein
MEWRTRRASSTPCDAKTNGRDASTDDRLNEIVGLYRKFYEPRDCLNGILRHGGPNGSVGLAHRPTPACLHDAKVSVTFIEK